LRAASAFLSTKRSSSVFTDSLDDLSSRLDDISGLGGVLEERRPEKYEKDIRDIVEYFERKKEKKMSASGDEVDTRTSPEIARSQKIESLIPNVYYLLMMRGSKHQVGKSGQSNCHQVGICNC